jgi:hypothetical protein
LKVYFDERGHIKNIKYDDIVATSHNVVKVEAYADFDTSKFTVSISIKRADGIILGAYPMLAKVDGDKTYHEYLLTKEDTEISGAIQFTVRYEMYQVNDDDILELAYSKPAGMFSATVYEAVIGDNTSLILLGARLDKLEDAIKNIEVTGGYKEIEISRTEPEDKTKDRLWLKIL